MNSVPLITIVLGTRPEAIKFAPLILKLKSTSNLRVRVVLTGQHKEMVSQVMKLFDLKSDNNLFLMSPNQTLTHITCETLKGLREDFNTFPPNLVLVQGDTTTAFASSLAAFYENIPVGHLEAGLRTNDLYNPFPEEANRRLISQISKLHFAPTKNAEENLNKSGITENIFVTGNTVIDALLLIAKKTVSIDFEKINWEKNKVLLVTLHRRENWGDNLIDIAKGVLDVLKHNPNTYLILPMHKNKIVREPLKQILGSHERVILTEPLAYDQLVAVLKKCTLVLTDSGGLQEEAPSLGKPVLVLRTKTERLEGILSGTAKLIGTNPEKILSETNLLLNNENIYSSMARAQNPYGDGNSSQKIICACENYLFNKIL
tara:strand:+ start:8141 stop:9262 length:1122 start_codon:yes stop_codon:yes gene_type:complete